MTIQFKNPNEILPTIPLAELIEGYECNTLKQKHNRDLGDLKASILADGMIMPLIVWVQGKFVTDGAGRLQALQQLEYEGHEVPPIPYLPISANSKQEAKKHTLLISSKYGEITEESVADFLLDMQEIDLGNVNIGLDLDELDLKPNEPKPKKEKVEEVKIEKNPSKIIHTCPKCGEQFN